MAYELYWISGSPNAWRVMFAMELKGLIYTSHRLDPGKREHKAPEILALNPRGKVPILIDGDHILYESLAILAYLEKQHPEPALFGAKAIETGFIWQHIFEVMNYARDAINNGVVRPLIRGQAEHTGDKIKASAIQAHEALEWVETVLETSPYLAGASLSAADVSFMPIVQGLIRAGHRDDAKALDIGFDNFEKDYPCISAWLGKIEAVPGYDRAYPPHWRNG